MLKGVSVSLKIEGTVELIQREKIVPPKDGIHRAGKEGFIKGVHSVMLNDTLIPKGSVGFFYPLGKEKGVKVYLGGFPNKPWASKLKVVQHGFKNMSKLNFVGLAPTPHKIIGVKIRYMFKDNVMVKYAYGLKVDRCHYPPHTWKWYAKGLPYRFDTLRCKDHPKHTPDGYFDFCKRLKEFCKNSKMVLSCFDYRKDAGPKLGDVLYCMKRKNWYLVDCDT